MSDSPGSDTLRYHYHDYFKPLSPNTGTLNMLKETSKMRSSSDSHVQ